MKKKSLNLAVIRLIASLIFVTVLVFSFTACGQAGQQSKMTTEELSTEKYDAIQVDEPDFDIDPGVNITEASTEATTEATTESTTEVTTEATTEATTSAPTGQYSYDVDGHTIYLHTNIDDYIVWSAQYSSYGVDLVGIATSLGLEPVDPNKEIIKQVAFWTSNEESKVYFDSVQDGGLYEIQMVSNGNGVSVSFTRDDISSSMTPYWVSLEDTAVYTINYEQIVIFTYLMENCAYSPSDNWMEEAGFTSSSSHLNSYTVNK